MGLSRFELLTPRLSSVCSNQLSYRPETRDPPISRETARRFRRETRHADEKGSGADSFKTRQNVKTSRRRPSAPPCGSGLEPVPDRSEELPTAVGERSRKEVIQPQVLLQLPCYDFTPITNHTLGTCLPCGLAQLLLVQPAFVM